MMDKSRTIADIKKIRYNFVDITSLTSRVSDLMFNKKIEDFDAEDLRLLIGQNESLELCIPLALELLKDNPMIEGDYYPGDLLVSVLRASPIFWEQNPHLKKEAEDIFISNKDRILNYDTTDEIRGKLIELFDGFL